MGDVLLGHLPRLVGMVLLLAMSGFFSGSETALFSLSRDRLRRFRQGRHRLEHLAAQLVARPRSLLVTILFGNMLVNVMFFALSSGMIWDIGHRVEAAWAEPLAGLVVLMIVIVFGEVAPKTVAATAPAPLARAAAFPLYLLSRALTPVTYVLDLVFIEPATRLVTGRRGLSGAEGPHLTGDELQAIVDLAGDEGVVDRDEGEMISEVLRIHETRVREVMVPRVDIAMCDADLSTADVLAVFRETRHKRLVVYRETPDEVVGLVSARRAFLDPDRPLGELLEPVTFVPEQQTVERLLTLMRERGIQLAVVVDEYGGTAGLVTLEDCLEEIVGEIADEHEAPEEPVVRVSDREFILSGDLSMRVLSEYLKAETGAEPRVATLGGFVTALLGRVPREGDVVDWGNLRLTVEEVRRRRPVKVRVEMPAEAGAAPPVDPPMPREAGRPGEGGGHA